MLQVNQNNLGIGFVLGIILPIMISYMLAPATIVFTALFVMVGLGTFFGYVMMIHQNTIKKYPISIILYEKRADALIISLDRARQIISPEKGQFEYQLKFKKMRTKPINWKYVHIGVKGQSFLHLYMPQRGEIHPMSVENIDEISKKIKPTPENAKYWYSEQLRRNHERWSKKSSIEKYMPLAMVLAVGMIITIMIYMFLGQVQPIMSSLSGTIGEVSNLAVQVSDVARSLNPTLSIPTINAPAGLPPPPPPSPGFLPGFP